MTFRRTDLAQAKFINCEARGVTLHEPRVVPGSTRLQLRGIDPISDVTGIRSTDDVLYDPIAVVNALKDCGADISDPRAVAGQIACRLRPELVQLMERLMRAYRRANPVCTADKNLSHLFRASEWPSLQKALIRHGIVKEESRGTGGKRKTFLRRQYSPDQIMAGIGDREDIDPQIAAFWNDLAS